MYVYVFVDLEKEFEGDFFVSNVFFYDCVFVDFLVVFRKIYDF